MSYRSTPSKNLRYTSIKVLLKIKANNYKSAHYKDHYYNAEAVESELKRKMSSKRYKGNE